MKEEKEIKEVITYVASDGHRFVNKKLCEEHEKAIEEKRRNEEIKLKFSSIKSKIVYIPDVIDDNWGQITLYYITSEEDLKTIEDFLKLGNQSGWVSYNIINTDQVKGFPVWYADCLSTEWHHKSQSNDTVHTFMPFALYIGEINKFYTDLVRILDE